MTTGGEEGLAQVLMHDGFVRGAGYLTRRCLEAEADRLATEPERQMIELEREFGTPDPAARAIGGDGLPGLLLMLTTDAWLPTDPQDRRVQLQVLGAFGRWLESPRNGWFASYCSVLTLQVEVDRRRAADRAQGRGLAAARSFEHG